MVQKRIMDTDKIEKKPPSEPLPEDHEEEMGQTMMDINPTQFSNKNKKEETADSSKGEESVDDLLRKKKSLKERLGLGKFFGKKT